MENVKPLQRNGPDPRVAFLGRYGVEVPSFTGTTWLDELTEDLESEAVLAVLEGRDPEEAVEDYINHEAENCPVSCVEKEKNGEPRVCNCDPVRDNNCRCSV